jgi:hypothetical protein
MEHFSTTDSLQDAIELRECPECGRITSFIYFKTYRKDASPEDEQEFYRCMKCLKVYQLKFEEVE